MQIVPLATGWELARRTPDRPLAADLAADGWIPAPVPGTVHEALLAAGQIPDPFYGANELAVQWVGEADWVYRCRFEAPADLGEQPAALAFDGLDTVATVYLNREQILASDNMFVPARVPVTGRLRPGANELAIVFASALRHGQALEAEHGRRPTWNTDPSRVYVRKAQYHYGWDWGPCLITAGPWGEVRLEIGAARIADLACAPELAEDLRGARLPVDVALEGVEPGQRLHLWLEGPDGSVVAEAEGPAATMGYQLFVVERPALWWPRGHGEQPLYTLGAALCGPDGETLHERTLRLGLRRLRLVQEPVAGEPGASFMFEVNGRPIFAGGANWIPADSFTTRIPEATYRRLLSLAAEAGMSMLRVWGGGIYEPALFYELCDELGLLVWQDFMFACGVYPAHPAFLASVRAEAEAQVRRLRHHASLAIWCGNNEDYQIAADNRLYHIDRMPEENPEFPARVIYERLLPEVCAALDPARPYWPGSPYGGHRGADPTVGDRHTWDVWHGAMAPFQQYPRFAGRFVSEFGMQAAPAPATLEAVIPAAERHPLSMTMERHNKAPDGPRRLAAYLSDIVRGPTETLADYSYATQLLQAEALGYAYRHWRRRWQGPGRYAVAGALVWQLNDCWPVVSWALVDSALRPKAALYAVARELAPVAVGLAHHEGAAAVWAVNGRPEPVRATLELSSYTLDGEPGPQERREVELAPLGATELGAFRGPGGPGIVAALLSVGDAVVARAALWPEPLKYVPLPHPGVTAINLGDDRVELRCLRPAKGVWLEAGDDVGWEDNYLDLLPDELRVIRAPGLGGRAIMVRHL
jgi:beta-mannosidase